MRHDEIEKRLEEFIGRVIVQDMEKYGLENPYLFAKYSWGTHEGEIELDGVPSEKEGYSIIPCVTFRQDWSTQTLVEIKTHALLSDSDIIGEGEPCEFDDWSEENYEDLRNFFRYCIKWSHEDYVEDVRGIIESCFWDLGFEYNGLPSGVTAVVHDSVPEYQAWHGKEIRYYNSVDDVMNDKFYSGKSLYEIADVINYRYT